MPPATLEKPRTGKIQPIVDEYASLYPRFQAMNVRLAELKTKLIESGEANYLSRDGHQIQVIFPAPKIAPPQDAISAIEKLIGAKNTDILFEFVRKPVKSCRQVAERILPPEILKKFFKLAEVDCAAQVRFS